MATDGRWRASWLAATATSGLMQRCRLLTPVAVVHYAHKPLGQMARCAVGIGSAQRAVQCVGGLGTTPINPRPRPTATP